MSVKILQKKGFCIPCIWELNFDMYILQNLVYTIGASLNPYKYLKFQKKERKKNTNRTAKKKYG